MTDYLTDLLDAYWFAPPVALWRAVELRAASDACRAVERPLLDLGCGDGLIGRILFGGRPVDAGIDPWSGQLQQAARSGVYRRVDRAVGDALPYPDDHFAAVFSNSVLEHIPVLEPVIRDVGRVLETGGRFIFTVPSDDFRRMLDGYARRAAAGDQAGAEAYAQRVDRRLEHYHYHTPDEWRQLLAIGGMDVIETHYYVPEPVERFWDRANQRYGIGRRWSPWRILASPRLRTLGYQPALRRLIVNRLSTRWRPLYEMDVQPGRKGGGLLVVAERRPERRP